MVNYRLMRLRADCVETNSLQVCIVDGAAPKPRKQSFKMRRQQGQRCRSVVGLFGSGMRHKRVQVVRVHCSREANCQIGPTNRPPPTCMQRSAPSIHQSYAGTTPLAASTNKHTADGAKREKQHFVESMPDQREEETDTSRAPAPVPASSTRGTKRKTDDGATLNDDDNATTTSAGVAGTAVDPSTAAAGGVTAAGTSDDPEQQVNHPKKKTKKTKREEEQEDMAWICAACKEAECGLVLDKNAPNKDSDKGKDEKKDGGAQDNNVPVADEAFVFCDGPCGRIFHLPCAGLGGVPEADQWLCKDCTQQRHACAYCAEYGRDGIDVFPCSRVEGAACGLFFHEACLQANGVEYKYAATVADAKQQQQKVTTSKASANEEDEDDAQQRIPVFTCPAHNCWTCTQNDIIQLEREEEAEERKNRKSASKKREKQTKKKKSCFQCKPTARLFVRTLSIVIRRKRSRNFLRYSVLTVLLLGFPYNSAAWNAPEPST